MKGQREQTLQLVTVHITRWYKFYPQPFGSRFKRLSVINEWIKTLTCLYSGNAWCFSATNSNLDQKIADKTLWIGLVQHPSIPTLVQVSSGHDRLAGIMIVAVLCGVKQLAQGTFWFCMFLPKILDPVSYSAPYIHVPWSPARYELYSGSRGRHW